MSGSDSGSLRNFGALVARTALAGVALINGAQAILSWTAPNDGQLHTVTIAAGLRVTGNETGGQMNMTSTLNGVAFGVTLLAAGQVAGVWPTTGVIIVDPGQTVAYNQQTALTAGAASAFAVFLAI